jgi:S1-C subfamily serine protease
MSSRLLCLLLLTSMAHAESPGEDAFRAAADWTVQVRTAVNQPFIEDDQGSWFGAGLLVDATRGWVLTNAHVASHSYGKISIAFKDGHAIPATRLYVDPYLDLAVLAFEPSRQVAQTRTPTLSCSEIPPVGHPVGAFGHPWGFRFTGTRGITSAVTTRLGVNMLQTDAPINEGNSGGPLISLESGQVVGINTAKVKEESVEGLSFAVPMPYACTILDLLRAGRDPSPPATVVDFARDDNDELTMIVARSRLPADALDLRVGDEVLGLGAPTRDLATVTDLMDGLRGHLDPVSLRVRRDGRELTLNGRWPPAAKITERRGLWLDGAVFASAESLTAGLIVGSPALMVHHVDPGSDAETAGVMHYDLVVTADRAPVASLDALLQRARQAQARQQPLELLLLRIGDDSSDELFVYEHRLLPAQDIGPVGP